MLDLITQKRSEDILCSIEKIVDPFVYTTPKKLASVAGKIVSANYILGNISSLIFVTL